MNDIRLALLTGIDIPIPECKLILHQPRIKEISYIGENDFFVGIQTLCLNKSMFIQDKAVLDEVNNFQIFMTVIGEQSAADKKIAAKKVLQITFPDYTIMFSPRSIIFQKDGESFPVDESNFEFLQQTMRLVFCSKDGPMDQQAFNPANAKAKEIADKLMRGRQRVAEIKGSANASVFSQYLSIISIALHLSLLEVQQYTMYQIYDTIERYSLYINWDLDVRVRLAGGKPDSHPEDWMKNIHIF